MGVSTTAKVVAASAVAIFGTTMLSTVSAGATALPQRGSVELIPVCVSAQANVAVWQAFNKNTETVSVSWNNLDAATTGTAQATNDRSYFVTDYKAGTNNDTKFSYATQGGSDDVQRNANNGTTCTPEQLALANVQLPEDCKTADEVVSSDIHATFVSRYHAIVKYVATTPLCDDTAVQINFTGYVIENPDYNGGYLENNPTATPQRAVTNHTQWMTKHDTKLHLYIEASKYDDCQNMQIDVYRNDVLWGFNDLVGHGERNILSEMHPATSNHCYQHGNDCDNEHEQPHEQPVEQAPAKHEQPGSGAGIVVEAESVKAVQTERVAEAKPAQLADTGERSFLPAIAASLLALTAAVVALPLRRRNQV